MPKRARHSGGKEAAEIRDRFASVMSHANSGGPNACARSMNKLRAFVITIMFVAAFASFALAETTAFTADLRGSFEVPPVDSKQRAGPN
jgi:hypothetical protein